MARIASPRRLRPGVAGPVTPVNKIKPGTAQVNIFALLRARRAGKGPATLVTRDRSPDARGKVAPAPDRD